VIAHVLQRAEQPLDHRCATRPSKRRVRWALALAACAAAAFAPAACAADSSELWPELSAYVRLGEQTRLYLDAAYAKGLESDERSLDLGAYLDVSLMPILREELRREDWQRNRYLWARVGYTRIFKASNGPAEVAEDRGVLALYARAPLPEDTTIEGRVRADLRWLGGDYSTRYRLRAEVNREFTVAGHTVVPYANAEWFYDTRYGGWSRTLVQAGPEITVSKNFRYEIYLAWQADRLPKRETLNALGVLAKWYY
jgi:hypothetical protein